MLLCSGGPAKANLGSQQSQPQAQAVLEQAGPLCLQLPRGPGAAGLSPTPLNTRQLCGAGGQPGVQGRWLRSLWQSHKQPQTICMLGGTSPPTRGCFTVEQLLWVARSGTKQQLPLQTWRMGREQGSEVRRGQHGVLRCSREVNGGDRARALG